MEDSFAVTKTLGSEIQQFAMKFFPVFLPGLFFSYFNIHGTF